MEGEQRSVRSPAVAKGRHDTADAAAMSFRALSFDESHADLNLLKVRSQLPAVVAHGDTVFPWHQATIERLRTQRIQVERLKWDSQQKDAAIASLRAENSRLNAEVCVVGGCAPSWSHGLFFACDDLMAARIGCQAQ